MLANGTHNFDWPQIALKFCCTPHTEEHCFDLLLHRAKFWLLEDKKIKSAPKEGEMSAKNNVVMYSGKREVQSNAEVLK